ncbi:hypothetical protein OKA04_23295 [Luteolibacter flavescens]|uniref:Uncharacterized protein n=1 Tax=Luteolibacter flavescens TaxID=1859460 RepID=A0ABT3FVT4_9BACT|nr:hypothetical protein [Luteolibacter flavescens]MCW1887682.1 hypothetical protein [Luteolibacter flavescens]
MKPCIARQHAEDCRQMAGFLLGFAVIMALAGAAVGDSLGPGMMLLACIAAAVVFAGGFIHEMAQARHYDRVGRNASRELAASPPPAAQPTELRRIPVELYGGPLDGGPMMIQEDTHTIEVESKATGEQSYYQRSQLKSRKGCTVFEHRPQISA